MGWGVLISVTRLGAVCGCGVFLGCVTRVAALSYLVVKTHEFSYGLGQLLGYIVYVSFLLISPAGGQTTTLFMYLQDLAKSRNLFFFDRY